MTNIDITQLLSAESQDILGTQVTITSTKAAQTKKAEELVKATKSLATESVIQGLAEPVKAQVRNKRNNKKVSQELTNQAASAISSTNHAPNSIKPHSNAGTDNSDLSDNAQVLEGTSSNNLHTDNSVTDPEQIKPEQTSAQVTQPDKSDMARKNSSRCVLAETRHGTPAANPTPGKGCFQLTYPVQDFIQLLKEIQPKAIAEMKPWLTDAVEEAEALCETDRQALFTLTIPSEHCFNFMSLHEKRHRELVELTPELKKALIACIVRILTNPDTRTDESIERSDSYFMKVCKRFLSDPDLIEKIKQGQGDLNEIASALLTLLSGVTKSQAQEFLKEEQSHYAGNKVPPTPGILRLGARSLTTDDLPFCEGLIKLLNGPEQEVTYTERNLEKFNQALVYEEPKGQAICINLRPDAEHKKAWLRIDKPGELKDELAIDSFSDFFRPTSDYRKMLAKMRAEFPYFNIQAAFYDYYVEYLTCKAIASRLGITSSNSVIKDFCALTGLEYKQVSNWARNIGQPNQHYNLFKDYAESEELMLRLKQHSESRTYHDLGVVEIQEMLLGKS